MTARRNDVRRILAPLGMILLFILGACHSKEDNPAAGGGASTQSVLSMKGAAR
jgi:hypothetical protein